jgi:hypothetical protein
MCTVWRGRPFESEFFDSQSLQSEDTHIDLKVFGLVELARKALGL